MVLASKFSHITSHKCILALHFDFLALIMSDASQRMFKGTISGPEFQTSLFLKPPDFLHIQRENFTVIKYLDITILMETISSHKSFHVAW